MHAKGRMLLRRHHRRRGWTAYRRGSIPRPPLSYRVPNPSVERIAGTTKKKCIIRIIGLCK